MNQNVLHYRLSDMQYLRTKVINNPNMYTVNDMSLVYQVHDDEADQTQSTRQCTVTVANGMVECEVWLCITVLHTNM